MGQQKATVMAGLVILVVILAACAQSAPSVPATVAPVAAKQAISLPEAPLSSSANNAEWNKLIEAAKRERSLTVYSYTFAGSTGIAVSQSFKEKYGIAVEFVAGLAPVFLERIQSEARAGNHVADAADLPISRAPILTGLGLVASLKDLPVFGEQNVWLPHPLEVDPSGQSLTMYYTITGPNVNTRK